MQDYLNCRLCPRQCGADRAASRGFCGLGSDVRIARAGLHMWEEPPISGERGAGTVFFSGCTLKCVFCQNYEISQLKKGRNITESELADEFLRLRDIGAENIELVSPTPFLPSIINVLDKIKPRLGIPIVMNTGGYERVETIKRLKGYVDVYLPDIKYFDPVRSKKYSGAEDYFEIALEAVKEMVSQTGKPLIDRRGVMQRGVIIRHLVMPGGRADSAKIIGELGKCFSADDILISLMSQYTPMYRAGEFREINRRVSTFEYNFVLDRCLEAGFGGFMQERESATDSYLPEFEGNYL